MHKLTAAAFPHLDFGDVRRNERFVSIVTNLSSQPGASIPRQNQSWYDTKATYAFFKNKEVSLEALNKTMRQYGVAQTAGAPSVLIVHDISNISYNDLKATGLGYLDNKAGRGILCYSSLALTPEGLPLALLYQHTWTRPLEELGKAAQRKQRPFEDKETYQWHEGMKQTNALLGDGVHKLHIADREADVYELFFHGFEPGTDLLIRACQHRSLGNGHALWDQLSAQAVMATVQLEVPDETGKKKRRLEAEVRYQRMEIRRPKTSRAGYESVVLTAIRITEKSKGAKKDAAVLDWKLLTTLEVSTSVEALQCVRWYTVRWLIERFHYVLKSGVKIEALQLKTAAGLQKAIVVYSLAAFRIVQLVYASRHCPEVSCEVALSKAQWVALYVLIHGRAGVPVHPPTLQQVVLWIGRLGGHLGRKGDGPPGLKTVWQGYQRLCSAASVYERLME